MVVAHTDYALSAAAAGSEESGAPRKMRLTPNSWHVTCTMADATTDGGAAGGAGASVGVTAVSCCAGAAGRSPSDASIFCFVASGL